MKRYSGGRGHLVARRKNPNSVYARMAKRMLCLVDQEHGLQDVTKVAEGNVTLSCGCVRKMLSSEIAEERSAGGREA